MRLSIRDTAERIEQLCFEIGGDAAHEVLALAGNLSTALDRIAGALGMPVSAAPRAVADRVGGLATVELISACQAELAEIDGIEAEITQVWPIDNTEMIDTEDLDEEEGGPLEWVGWSCSWSARYTAPCGRSVRYFGCSDEVFGASVARAGVGLAWTIVAHRNRVMPHIIAQWTEEDTTDG